jgi:uncharacterized membrane protein
MALIQTIPDDNTLKPSIIATIEGRLISLDALRGLIIMLMAIDHASYFIAKVHQGEFWGVALPQYLSILSFLTRWITHLCAPGFFFLMGSGMILFAASRRKAGWTENKILRFFITRGILLIIIQLLVENPAWLLGTIISKELKMMEPPGGGGEVMLHFGVLYGLGSNMIVFAFLLRANTVFIALLSIGSILFTQWLTPGASEVSVLYTPLHRLMLIPGHTGLWQSFYPLIPWLGITGFGIIFGKLLLKNREKLFRYTLIVGVTFLIFFVFIRWIGGYGNFHAWNNGWIAFLNVTKYPPSLSFVLLTLGINLLLLFLFSRIEETLPHIGQPLLIFGRSALFFYVVHLYLYATIGCAFPNGTSYQLMYLFWFIGLLILFPLCLWYGKFKRKKTIESIWKFF